MVVPIDCPTPPGFSGEMEISHLDYFNDYTVSTLQEARYKKPDVRSLRSRLK